MDVSKNILIKVNGQVVGKVSDLEIKNREYTGEWAKAWREAFDAAGPDFKIFTHEPIELIPNKEEIVITYHDGTEIGSMDCI